MPEKPPVLRHEVMIEALDRLIATIEYPDQVDETDLIVVAARYYRQLGRERDALAVFMWGEVCPVHERALDECASEDSEECRQFWAAA